MKEHPILFSGPMIRAIGDDRKTQTRRIMSPQPEGDPAKQWPDPDRWSWPSSKARTMLSLEEAPCACPYGYKGDRLWARETFQLSDPYDRSSIVYRADHNDGHPKFAEDEWTWRPSIFMPRWASRVTLAITDVRVQRLQDISEADAKAEGYRGVHGAVGQMIPGPPRTARDARELFWHSNNIKRATWEANPWVWAISFSRVT